MHHIFKLFFSWTNNPACLSTTLFLIFWELFTTGQVTRFVGSGEKWLLKNNKKGKYDLFLKKISKDANPKLQYVGRYKCEKPSSSNSGKSFSFIVALRFIRIFRFVRLLRIYFEHRNLVRSIRQRISENKRRYQAISNLEFVLWLDCISRLMALILTSHILLPMWLPWAFQAKVRRTLNIILLY